MNKNARKGFSFFETVISILLLLLGVLFIGSLFPASVRSLTNSAHITTATSLAQAKLEDALQNHTNMTFPSTGAFPDYPDYHYNLTKNTVAWSSSLKQIKCEVYHLENKKPVIDAVLSELVPDAKKGKYKLYTAIGNNIPDWNFSYSAPDWNHYMLTASTYAPEKGTYIITLSGSIVHISGSPPKMVAESIIYVDQMDSSHLLSKNQIIFFTGFRFYEINSAVAVNLDAGWHTFRLFVITPNSAPSSDIQVCDLSMIIEYIPDSLGEFKPN